MCFVQYNLDVKLIFPFTFNRKLVTMNWTNGEESPDDKESADSVNAKKDKKELNSFLHHEESKMHQAILSENYDRIEELLMKGETFCHAEGLNCYFTVHANNNWDILRKMLQHDVSGLNSIGPHGKTLLMCEVNNVINFKYLLALRADPNVKFEDGDTLLIHAIKNNADVEVLNALLNTGVDPNQVNRSSSTPLICAIEHYDTNHGTDIIDMLLRAGANVSQTDITGNNALMHAILTDCPPIIIANFLKHGADPLKSGWDECSFDLAARLAFSPSSFYWERRGDELVEIENSKSLWPVLDFLSNKDWDIKKEIPEKLRTYLTRKNEFTFFSLLYWFHFLSQHKEDIIFDNQYNPHKLYLELLSEFTGHQISEITNALFDSPFKDVSMTTPKIIHIIYYDNPHSYDRYIENVYELDTIGCFIMESQFKTENIPVIELKEWIERFFMNGFNVNHTLLSPLTLLIAIYGNMPYGILAARNLITQGHADVNQRLLPLFDEPILMQQSQQMLLPDALYLAATFGKLKQSERNEGGGGETQNSSR
jgi:ankyrin repeat protein